MSKPIIIANISTPRKGIFMKLTKMTLILLGLVISSLSYGATQSLYCSGANGFTATVVTIPASPLLSLQDAHMFGAFIDVNDLHCTASTGLEGIQCTGVWGDEKSKPVDLNFMRSGSQLLLVSKLRSSTTLFPVLTCSLDTTKMDH